MPVAEPPPDATEAALRHALDDPRLARLRHDYRAFVFPVALAFLLWFLTYVLCSAFARDWMGQRVVGEINVALVFGLLQFVSTFLIAWCYGRYAHRRLDPLAASLRAAATEAATHAPEEGVVA